jgi:hypothetical protein
MFRPLLPTQMLQTIYAGTTQLALFALVAACHGSNATQASWLRVGSVGALALTLYSLGRLIFFTLRQVI